MGKTMERFQRKLKLGFSVAQEIILLYRGEGKIKETQGKIPQNFVLIIWTK
jgi:hypothetical protein